MVQSVELLLDERSEAVVREQWAALARAGIASPRGETHRPHVTIAVAREIWPRIDRALAGLAFQPLPIRLGGLLVFGARRPILVRAVVVTEELLALHRQIDDLVEPCPGVPATMRPGAWTPHVTLARRVPPDRLGAAVDAVAADHDFPAVVVGVRRWDGDARQERVILGGR
ncbi:2'-5' RNA ligase family protein [Nocardia neocaledoniensis]|uniref:2'-5' RNA ligase superfamily protein n=1 Tax=Nocardia neocaledoniensis TaxID=236511 RepID=A0A317N5W1_9NOCA|nr:2'-5' RNA ligase family protein [Nocardia neocaledoniensis]PWV70676.1 2'-5' RNA ligase superfamily protein [Nocardia neocaledoniensis]